MLNRSNSVNQQLNYKKPNILSNIYKFQTIHIKNQDNSAVKLPALKNIKNIIKQSELTSLNNNNETTKSRSHQIKSDASNGIFIPIFKNLNRKVYNSRTERTKKMFPIKLSLKSLNNLKLKKSPSVEILPVKDIPNVYEFHKKLMEQNQISCTRRLKGELIKYRDSLRDKEKIKEMVSENRDKRKSNTGIYGPNNNIVSIIMARIQRLRLENEYKGVDEELKELIKDEIIDAQVRLKMKPNIITMKKGKSNPLFLEKLNKYKYLTKLNLMREINQNAVVPIMVNDGNMMIKLINEAFGIFKMKNKD